MTGGDPMMPPDLDRLLASATVPDMSAGLIDRIVAEAARPGRTALPVARPPRSRGRQWTRRGVWSGIVAVNLMLATAVAAAFGGGALTFATIATVARHVVEHIRAPFHHAEPRTPPTRPAVVHRLAVPAAAILTAPRAAFQMSAPRAAFPMSAPRAAMPMSAPRAAMPMPAPQSFGRRATEDRPRVGRAALPVSARPLRSLAIDRGHSPARAGPYAIRHAEQHQRLHDRSRDRPHDVVANRGEASPRGPLREARADRRAPMASPATDPLPRAQEPVNRDAPNAARDLEGEGGRRFDGTRGQTPAAAATDGGTGDRGGSRAQAWAQGQDRTPGWRRRMQGNTSGAGAPGWRRRAGLNGGGGGGGRPGGRMKQPRPGGGRHPRRF